MDFGTRLTQPGSPGNADIIKDATSASFAADVIAASRDVPVIVDFWAPWCGPCKQLTPIIEKVVRSYNGKVRLVKMNIDQHPSIAGQLRVQSIPAVFAFVDGRPVDAFQGAQPESQVRAFIDRLVGEEAGADIEEALKQAQQALDTNDLQAAAEIFAAVLQQEGQNPIAIAGLASCYLKSGDVARAEQTIGLVPPDKANVAAVAQVKAAIDLKKMADSAGDTSVLLAKVQANPKDHQARIDLAKAYAAHGKKSEALDQLLESIRADRKWSDEAARKQLVQFFEAWGPKDAATLEGRRRLSSILFA